MQHARPATRAANLSSKIYPIISIFPPKYLSALQEMMQFAIATCREKSCYKVCLSSNLKRENAHQFYEGIGFRKHGYSFLTELA